MIIILLFWFNFIYLQILLIFLYLLLLIFLLFLFNRFTYTYKTIKTHATFNRFINIMILIDLIINLNIIKINFFFILIHV